MSADQFEEFCGLLVKLRSEGATEVVLEALRRAVAGDRIATT
jgi:hypothetical protein